jgi:hypothetical protein
MDITIEMLEGVDEKTLRALESIPATKELVLEFRGLKNKGIIEFSNQESFLFQGSHVTLALLEMIAYSSLGGKKDDNEQSEHGELKRQAWDILHRVKAGKKAQGETYNLTPDGFRARLA